METLVIRRFTYSGTLRLARAAEYEAWYRGYEGKGREPTFHFPSMRDHMQGFYVARENFKLKKILRPDEVHIIIPVGILGSCEPIEEGQENVDFYEMDGYNAYGTFVPKFDDFRGPNLSEMQRIIEDERYVEEYAEEQSSMSRFDEFNDQSL